MANKFFSSLPWQCTKATGATYTQKKGKVPSLPTVTDTPVGYPAGPASAEGSTAYNRATKFPTVKTHVAKKGIH